jgi:hypothetical protein
MAANKRVGKKSLAQNDHLFPAAPLIGTATNVGTGRAYNNGAATVTFTAQGPNAATSYTVTSSPGGYTGTGSSSPITVQGLQSEVNYSFTVTATNAYGTGPASSASNTILATTVPATPSAPSASSPSAGVDRISWTAPANGGSVITNYFWASDDGKSGNTTSTTVDIGQEQGTAQTYTVRADNANGSSGTSAASNSVTTTFSFAPFGAFGFSPFGAFGFSPFGAFGFSPFGFSPYSPPACIAENTEIATVGEDSVLVFVKAKDLKVGDTVLSPVWDEFDGTPSPYESRIEYDALTSKRVGFGEVGYVLRKTVDKSIVFNGNPEKHFSTTQPVLARKSGQKDAWEFSGELSVGDIIWEYDFEKKEYVETTIEKVDLVEGNVDVFQVGVNGIDTFIAGGIISHNK